jgi:ribosome-associated translation inhibitor RaiA
MTRRNVPAPPPLVVELTGEIAGDLADYARTKLDRVLARTAHPVLHARLRVERHRDPARERPVTAQVQVDLDGRPLHVEVVATTPREAVDLLLHRLAGRLERASPTWEARRGRTWNRARREWRGRWGQGTVRQLE